MNLGANGVISVASHTNGDEMHAMLEAIENSDLKTAAAIQRKFIPKLTLSSQYQALHLLRLFLTILVSKLDHFVCHWLHVLQKKLNVSSRLSLKKMSKQHVRQLQVSFVQIIKKMKLSSLLSFLVEIG